MKRRLAEDLALEEGNGRGPQVAGALSKLALDEEMMEIGPDFFQSELFGRTVKVIGQSEDGIDIALDGAFRELPQLHLANHALAKRGHSGLLEPTRMGTKHAPNERASIPIWLKPALVVTPVKSPNGLLFLRRAV
jgi:hypothetical protein